ncbi:epidermal growth factor receptor kinase substrate 8-like protein 3 [Melopsittacus undulatus]|uniref:epidermal growth factor receptor kinase substrate 8-like protein 3 n=1 Tax=Melopsittacus undulatus TaxID=13146 RepID=UPI00146A4CDB|nr:epidermal growth factor receptor kinase substrate 8-like protein 3 [Melopsittacus undulatus]
MGDPLGGRSSPAGPDQDGSSPVRISNSFTRPTGKSIYNQRKGYGQSLLQPQSRFQHRVEHLLTARLERDLRSAGDCVERLRALEAQGRLWAQDLILLVRDQRLVLSDVESKEELDAYGLGSIQGCAVAAPGIGSAGSVLAITVRDRSPPGTSVLLFQCSPTGAEALRSSLEELVKQCKEEQSSPHGHRSSQTPPYAQGPPPAPEQWAEPPEHDALMSKQHGLDHGLMGTQPPPWTSPSSPLMSEVDRDAEVLNHVLSDLELFITRVQAALGMDGIPDLRKRKKKKKNKALPPVSDYRDFFQKVKYALNLLARTRQHLQEPDPQELLGLLFSALSFVLAHCPDPGLAPSVEAPLLLPEAIELLEGSLDRDNFHTWKSLGTAWTSTRAEHPNSALVPRYIPVFSDGWMPPPMEQVQHGRDQDTPLPASEAPSPAPHAPFSLLNAEPPGAPHRDNPAPAAPPAGQGLVRALYGFQGRNPQELSIRMGDTLQVLDRQRRWWLVRDHRGGQGFVPSNILEPLWGGHGQSSPPSLNPDSPPPEVTAWLQDRGFSRITVRCLGTLSGQQLLRMRAADLRSVCPEEWRRLHVKLCAARAGLGLDPVD